jgi:hypothetical protein
MNGSSIRCWPEGTTCHNDFTVMMVLLLDEVDTVHVVAFEAEVFRDLGHEEALVMSSYDGSVILTIALLLTALMTLIVK